MVLYFFVIGACIGSFLNVVIHRLPKGESLLRPGSRCPACKTPIKWYHNIPIISYIFLRGRCASCGDKFSVRYPLVELTAGLLVAACYVKFGFTVAGLLYMVFASSLVAIAFIDIDHMIIPDVITLPGIVIGLLAAAFVLPVGLKFSFLGFLVGGGLFLLLAMIVPNAPDKLPIPKTALDWDFFSNGVLALMIGFLAFCFAAVVLARFLPKVPVANLLILDAPIVTDPRPVSSEAAILKIAIGSTGKVEGPCRPVGKVRFGDALIDAIAEGEFLSAGAQVKAVRVEGNRVIVTPAV